MKNYRTNLTALFLLAVFACLAVTSMLPGRKSPTCDELAHHIPPGYVLLTKGDFKMATDSPPLARCIVALPLRIFMQPNMPDDKNAWRTDNRYEFSRNFFYEYNNQPHKMILLSRSAVVIIGLVCGLVLFFWTKTLYGDKTALFSLFLYCFSPNILAHTRLATTDMTATLFILLSVCSFWVFVRNPSLVNTLLAGTFLGLAQLSKYTALLLYPLFIFLLIFELRGIPEGWKKAIFNVVLIFVISFIVMWAGYGFDSSPILDDAMRVTQKVEFAHHMAEKIFPFWNEDLSAKLDYFLFKVPFPLGAHVLGVLGVIRHAQEGHGHFFLGEWSSFGNPMYYIVAFLIKTPIPTILFLMTGLFVSLRRKIGRNERFVISTVILFFLTGSMSKLQLGLRYILPIYPFIFILAARSVELVKVKYFKVFSFALIVWYAFAVLWTWPDYLSYFNEFVGGSTNGYKFLRDSNIDWGQDLPALAAHLKKNNIEYIKLDYFGTADPASYGIDHRPITESERRVPSNEVYAVSVHRLESVKWASSREPTARIGGSIFVYDLRREDIPPDRK
ncbi:MAG: glycosyltransferase family 39 protein [Candidatus Omnitrophota bacterium]